MLFHIIKGCKRKLERKNVLEKGKAERARE